MRAAIIPAIVAGMLSVSPPPAHATSDEDQVRAILNGMNTLYNRSDFTGFAAHLCADMLRPAGVEAGWYATRRADGPTQITINSVAEVGPDVVANVRFQAANRAEPKTFDVEFVRDGAEWKACRYDPGRYV